MFQYIADLIVYGLLGLDPELAMTESVYFFVYDILKISVMIFLVVSVIGFVRTFVSADKMRDRVMKLPFGLGNLGAAMFGAVSPFCSCSSIPLFIGFVKARVPASVAFSFLITSPLVNEVAFVIMGGYFGWKIATAYAVAGILLGVLGGLFLGALGVEKDFILDKGLKICSSEVSIKRIEDKLRFAFREGWKTFKNLIPYVFFGVLLGSLIHGFVPQEFFENSIGKYDILAVPLAVILGIPIYAGCSMIAPLIFSITANGVPLGTSLAFMMSISGLSLPEAIILKRVMKMRLLVKFFGVVAVGIVAVGYLFNAVTQ